MKGGRFQSTVFRGGSRKKEKDRASVGAVKRINAKLQKVNFIKIDREEEKIVARGEGGVMGEHGSPDLF